MFQVPRRATLRSGGLLPILSLLMLALGALCRLAAPATAALGRWSPANPTTPASAFTEIHMALLPGDGSSYHSRILTWEDAGLGKGAELGWNVGASGCSNPPYTLPVIGSWNPGANIFCGGHTHLMAGINAELLSVGGHAFGQGQPGLRDSRTFVPGTGAGSGSWTGPPARPTMQQARFYPTVTTLADGRAVVTGGQGAAQVWFFGGRVNGDPPATGTGDLLRRYGRGTDTGWDFAIAPQLQPGGERPTPREGHSTVYLAGLSANAYFGGRDSSGSAADKETWLLRREDGATLDADYTYRWEKLGAGNPKPDPRSEHTAVSVSPTEMIVLGGTQAAGQEFWRLYKEGNAWLWQTVTVTSGTGPSARYGHTAVYLTSPSRMIVFGGSDTFGGTPADNGVYVFNFTGGGFSQGNWSKLSVGTGPGPGSRRDHTMVLHSNSSSLLVYGGHLGGGASSDTLWQLIVSGPTAAWGPIATNGPSPGPRANHATFYDGTFGNRLYIFGGEPAPSAAVDKFTYVIEPLPGTGTATWVRGDEAPSLLSGHSAVGDMGGILHARRPEIYNRGANTWTPQSNSGWLPTASVVEEYPVQFVVPGSTQLGGGGRLIRVGADPVARYLDIPVAGLAGGWQTVPTTNPPIPPFKPHTGVMYEPGKLLVVGDVSFSNAAKSFDATAIGMADWVNRPGGARSHHLNLVVLPNGQVLALGGLDATEARVRCPQLWTPSTGAWTTAGDCASGVCALECEPVERDYHSTAMLLPDGRVLTGGGTDTPTTTELRVFCPPYLDEDQEWTTRPQITSAPTSITYGEAFIIGKQSSDVIASACLIRPAATTHGFDQNQRFVPLAFEALSGTSLRALAPGNGSIAPPGYYLLFTVNQNGVPAVARWIRLSNCPSVPCDHEPPPVVGDLYVDIVGPNEIWLAWSAPGDDRNPALGAYDMRFSASPITSENAFAAATQVGAPYPPPTPGPLGGGQSCAKTGLAACTSYYFALKTRDGATNWSTRAILAGSTTCDGGGGGFSARGVDGDAEGASAASGGPASAEVGPDGAAPAGTASLVPATGMLVAETRRATSGGWQVTLRLVSEPEGFDLDLAGAIVSQVRGEGGAWKTLGRHQPPAEQSPLGLCALRDQGRMVFPAGYTLDRVVSGLRDGGQELALSLANHSRLGSLGDRFIASGGNVEMVLGDAVTFAFTPTSRVLAEAASWYLMVRSAGPSGPATPARRELSPHIPTRFALHQNQPNPFRRTTSIAFDLPVTGPVTLEVFDLLGRKVATLAQGDHPAGVHSVEWNLRDANGGPVRAGVYVCRLVAGDFRAQTKMSVLP